MTEPSLDPDTSVASDRRKASGTSRWHKVVGGLGLVVTVWVGTEMYEVLYGDIGGGPGGHGPGGEQAPVENQDQDVDSDDGGEHSPPEGGHG